jgi:FkbM family methyltransferase
VSATPQSVFNTPDALRIVRARQDAVRPLLKSLRQDFSLQTAADVGCGIGHFSAFLHELGFGVVGIEGREQNVADAMSRYPGIDFRQGNVEDESLQRFGTFDLVFCMGLLYHLENPLMGTRHLRSITRTCLLLESMCLSDESPWMQLREEPRHDNQSLTDVAFYPSEGCLVKMLYRAGFTHVYRLATLPDHEDFRETADHKRRRTILLASLMPVSSAMLHFVSEPHDPPDPWDKRKPRQPSVARRIAKFLRKPLHEQSRAVYARWKRSFPSVPFPLRLPFGAWWVARNDYMGSTLTFDGFEPAERAFLHRFLKPGMTVLDLGAHHGFYTLLASTLVGPTGKVFAFEPSPRERKALRFNLKLNRCKNVTVQDFAVGKEETKATLHIVEGETGYNSLRPPALSNRTAPVLVTVRPLDSWIQQQGLQGIDFVKLDVEGGELDVLRGSPQMLQNRPRPVFLVEVQDVRTKPWGYRARDILIHLREKGYRWFRLSTEGVPEPLDLDAQEFDGNFVACPSELEPLSGISLPPDPQ